VRPQVAEREPAHGVGVQSFRAVNGEEPTVAVSAVGVAAGRRRKPVAQDGFGPSGLFTIRNG